MPLDFDLITGLNTSNSAALSQDTEDRISKIMGQTPDGSGGVIMPRTPSIVSQNDNPVSKDPQLKFKAAMNSWMEDTKRSDKDFMSGSGTQKIIPSVGTERYINKEYGYNPERDNEDFYAKQQSAMGELLKGAFLRFPALVVSKTGTGLGYLAGLVNPVNWGENYISNAADNAVARVFEGLEKNIKNDWLPSYQEAVDRNKGFFNRAFTDLNFWTDDVVDGAAFMASAFVPGMGISKIGVGAKAASWLSKIGLASENGVLGNLGITKLASYMKNAQSLATTVDKTLITAVNTASESMWEAKGVRDSVISNLNGKINPETGQVYTDLEKKTAAGIAARNTFLANTAILSVSNLWETNLIYKALGKEAGVTRRAITQNSLSEAFGTESTGALNRFLNSKAGIIGKEALKGVAIEGLYEENAQLAVQRFYDGTHKYKDILSQYLGQTRDAITGNDTEAAMNIGIGALMGLAGGIYSGYKDATHDSANTNALVTALNRANGAFLSAGNIYQQDGDNNIVFDSHGNPKVDTAKLAAFMSTWQDMSDFKELADSTNDSNVASIINKELLANLVKAHINAGIGDQILYKLDNIGSLDESTLVNLGFDPKSNTNVQANIASLKSYASQLLELYDTIERDVVGNPTSRTQMAEFQLRKDYLYQLGARQLALQQQSTSVNNTIESLKTRMTNPSATDSIVDDLNYLEARIESQKKFISQLDNESLDGTSIDRFEEERTLRDLERQRVVLHRANTELVKSLKRDSKGRYLYENPERHQSLLDRSLEAAIKSKAELDNLAKSTNTEFYKVADIDNGSTYYKEKLDKRIEASSPTIDNDTPQVDATQEESIPKSGKSLTVSMASNNDSSPINIDLEEGELYIGPLTTLQAAKDKGINASFFRNDKVRVVSINDDGTIDLSINGEPSVRFTQEDLTKIPAFKKYSDLSPLQRFYLHNRNKVINYRIPTKYNPKTKRWETKVVIGRLSYSPRSGDNEEVVRLAYKDENGNIKYIDFNRKYVVGGFSLEAETPVELNTAIREQENRLDNLRQVQANLFESLINNTDTEIELQKQRATDNQRRLDELKPKTDTLIETLSKAQQEFELMDKENITDKRSKVSRLDRTIKSLQTQLSELELLRDSLEQQQRDIVKRQAALSFMMDEYLSAYDQLLDTNIPITRSELTNEEQQLKELQEKEGNTNRLTTAQIEALLEDTNTEIEYVKQSINTIEPYIAALRLTLKHLEDEKFMLDLFTEIEGTTPLEQRSNLKNRLDAMVSSGQISNALQSKILNRVAKDPKLIGDVKYIRAELSKAENELNSLSNKLTALNEKQQRLTNAFNLRSDINNTTDRINYLKDVFQGLANEFSKQKAAANFRQDNNKVVARTVEDAKALKEAERLLSEFVTEPPSPIDQEKEERLIFSDSLKPVLTDSNNPLYKSADSHFPNDELNPQPYTQRFFKFTSQILLDGTYYVLPITESNDNQFGATIRYTSPTYTDDIKFVVTKKVGDKYIPVDMQGNTLTDANINNIIYSSFYGHPDLLSDNRETVVKWMKENFSVRESVSDEALFNKAQEFKKFRESIKSTIKEKGNIYLPISSKSNGIQNREPKSVTTGLPQELEIKGRLVPSNTKWGDINLVVSTVGTVPGYTTAKVKNGRLFIIRDNTPIQVYNRQLNTSEKENIRKILLKLVDTLGAKSTYNKYTATGIKLSQEEENRFAKDINDSELLTQYLSSILYWRGPTTDNPAIDRQFYIKNGYLYKGNKSITFDKDTINSKEYDDLMENVYHQVANVLLSADYVNKPYRELSIDSDNNLSFKEYSSYKEYLMSPKGSNSPVVYTNIVQLSDSQTIPQLKNVYLNVSPASESLQSNTPAATHGTRTTDISIEPDFVNKLTTGKDYVIHYVNPSSGVSMDFTFTYNGNGNISGVNTTVLSGNPTSEVVNRNTATVVNLLNAVDQNLLGYSKDADGNPLSAPQFLSNMKGKGFIISIEAKTPIEKTYDTTPDPQPIQEAIITLPAPVEPTEVTPPVSEKPKPRKFGELKTRMQKPGASEADDDNVRVVIRPTNYVKENIPKVKDWFKSNLPQFDTKFTDNLINNKYWGQFKNGIVYIYNEAEEGTGFHEAFEGVWNSILNNEEKLALTNEFKKRDNYKSLLKPIASQWKGLTEDQQIKEALAEEFRAYVLSDGKSIIKGQGKRNSFFRRLWEAIKSFLGLTSKEQLSIDNLFRSINTGIYKTSPVINYDKATAHFRAVPGVTQEVTRQAIEGIASRFFINLTKKGFNPETLFNKEGNMELISDLMTETVDYLYKKWELEVVGIAAQDLGYIDELEVDNDGQIVISEIEKWVNNVATETQQEAIDKHLQEFEDNNDFNLRDKRLIIDKFDTDVKSIFYDYLRQFGFVVKQRSVENETDDEAILDNKEVNATDTLGIRDSINIDTRNTANTTVRLLIASLTSDQYTDSQYKFKFNDLGLPIPIDFDKTSSLLFNELQGISSTINSKGKVDTIDAMFKSLDSKYIRDGVYKSGYEWINRLKRRLKYIDANGNPIAVTSLKSDDIRLRVAFIKSYTKNKNNPIKLILGDNNYIYGTDPITTSNSKRVREAWENNAKANFQRSNDFLTLKDNKISFNTQSPRFQELMRSTNVADRVQLLANIGITFNVPILELTQGKYLTKFSDAVGRIIAKIQDNTITNFDELFSSQIVNGPVNTLLSIEVENNPDNLSLQYRTPSGETEYSIVNPSLISNIVSTVRQSNTLSDLLLSSPQLGSSNNNVASLHRYQQGSELLTRILYDKDGNKLKDLTYNLISGVAQMTEADGDSTSRLKRPDKVIQEIYHMLNGTYYTIINSDKSSELALTTGAFVSMFDFTSSSRAYNPSVSRIYTNHLKDEVNALIDLKNGIGDNIQYYSTNQRDKQGNYLLTHFRDIITEPASLSLLQKAINTENSELFVNDNGVQVQISNYLDNFIKRQQQSLIDIGIVTPYSDGTYSTKGISAEQLSKFTSEGLKLDPTSFNQIQYDNLARFLFINHQIAVREQHKLIYGHPALYKDLPKRSNGATSTKEAIVDDTATLQWMDTNYPRVDGKVRSNDRIQHFNVVSYKDVTVISNVYKDMAEGMYKSMIKDNPKEVVEKRIGATFDNNGNLQSLILKNGDPTGEIKAYIEVNEADAHASIMPDFYRDLLFLSGKWSDKQNQQWDYEMAYERSKRAELQRNNKHNGRAYTSEEIADNLPQKDNKILEKGNPGAIFPVLKPQYFGYQSNNGLMHTTFLKHSVQPRFWRFFEGTTFEDKYIDAQNNQVDIIGYESGEKVGNILNDEGTFDSFYDDNGSINRVLPSIQKLITKFYGIQVEMAAKLKDKVVRGTQMTKIIMSNLTYEPGKVLPQYQSTIDEYNDILSQMSRVGKTELLKELGLEYKDGNYITTDLKKLVTTLRDEAVKRDLPSNIIEAFEASLGDSNTGLVYKFDSFSNRDKIDNILNAIVDSRVISAKMHGTAAVQAAVTLTEKLGNNRTILYLDKNNVYQSTSDYNSLTDAEKKTVRLGSSDLKFYRLENNKVSAMEVYLPHWFKEYYGKETPDITKLDSRLLRLIGFRIPTQGMNSIENIVVKGFLNPEEGDTIIVPSEITGKSGSDFDIDKMNLYIPNYKMVNGTPTYVEYTKGTTDKAQLENRLTELMQEILSFPENYRQLIVPNGATTLKSLADRILSLKGESKSRAIPFTQLSEWNYMNETRERFLVGKQLVGIGAIHITNHALSQISNILMKENPELGIRFKHNVDSEGRIYLSGITNTEGQWISELLSEFLTGFVDAAKDPFVFELNINPATAGSYFYLLRTGVPIDELAYFHTQPVISNYLRLQQVNESLLNKVNGDELRKNIIKAITMSEFVDKAFPTLLKDNGVKTTLKQMAIAATNDKGEVDVTMGNRRMFYDRSNFFGAMRRLEEEIANLANSKPIYTVNSLEKNISDYYNNRPLDQQQSQQQLLILSDFLRYQNDGSSLSSFVNSVAYDTARTKNIVENKLQEVRYNAMLEEGFIDNPKSILQKTFIGEMKKQKDDIPNMFANYFVFLHNNARQSFDRIYDFISSDALENATEDTKKEVLNRYQNFFLNYLLHTVRFINPITSREDQVSSHYNLLFNDSFAKQVKKLQKQFPENKLLQELFPLISTDRRNTDNVKLFVNKMSTYENNSIIESASELLEKAQQDPELKRFMTDLAIFSIIQSGVQQSPISYTKVLPNELYAQVAGSVFDRFTDSPNTLVDPTTLITQFFQNYYFNRTIVPLAKNGIVRADGLMVIPNTYHVSRYPFLAKRVDKVNPENNLPYTKSERESLIKNKEWDKLYDTRLYRKFLDANNNSFFRPVNKLGNRQYAIETYTTDTSAMTKDQIVLSDINNYVDEQSYFDLVKQTVLENQTPPSSLDRKDNELDSTQDDITCRIE